MTEPIYQGTVYAFHDPALARRLLPDGAGGMLAFDLVGGPCAAAALRRRLRTIAFAPSLGGTGTTVSYPPAALPAPGMALGIDAGVAPEVSP